MDTTQSVTEAQLDQRATDAENFAELFNRRHKAKKGTRRTSAKKMDFVFRQSPKE